MSIELISATPVAATGVVAAQAAGSRPQFKEANFEPTVANRRPRAERSAAAENNSERKKVEESVREINESLAAHNVSVQFSQNEEAGSIVIKVVDLKSGETLRQIPSEAALHLSSTLGRLQGKLLDERA